MTNCKYTGTGLIKALENGKEITCETKLTVYGFEWWEGYPCEWMGNYKMYDLDETTYEIIDPESYSVNGEDGEHKIELVEVLDFEIEDSEPIED